MSASQNPERDARLMQHLDEATARLLFPERFDEQLRVTLVHPPLTGATAERAARLAGEDTCLTVDPQRPGSPQVQRVTFTLERVQQLHDYYAILESTLPAAEVDILLADKRVPMERELWLPLLWLLRS